MKTYHYIIILALIILGWYGYRHYKCAQEEDKKEPEQKPEHDGLLTDTPTDIDTSAYAKGADLTKAEALEKADKAGMTKVELFHNSDFDIETEPSPYAVKIEDKTYYVSADTFKALKEQDDYVVWD